MSMISHTLGRVYPVALTIAGSDSGGGAGIQADLKTFAALQVHGTVAITSLTAQNTYEVTMVHDVPLDMIEEQIRVVYRDLGIDAAKSGMLHNSQIIDVVSKVLADYDFPYVLDPVMIAKSGAKLLRDDAINALLKKLFPRATIVTPNRFEAERIVGYEIKSLSDAEKAAEDIISLGPDAVVVKGGHIGGEYSIDVFYNGRNFRHFKALRVDSKSTHGTGCSFSAAITAFLARGYSLEDSVEKAKKFITISIAYGLEMGRGSGPVNPMAYLFNEASRYIVLEELYSFVKKLSSLGWIEGLIPEVGMNIAYSTPYPMDEGDIAAFPGRIRYSDGLIYGYPRFGVSRHLSRYILKMRRLGCDVRTAMNIRYEEALIQALKEKGYRIGFYDRRREPREVKEVEGRSVEWGVEEAYRGAGGCLDVIYHLGDWGKEPMIVLLARDLSTLLKILEDIRVVFK